MRRKIALMSAICIAVLLFSASVSTFADSTYADIRDKYLAQQYPTLCRGDEGEQVTDMQHRLSELGYLTADDVDGKYGPKTANAVSSFREINGLEGSGDTADSSFLVRLYGSSAKQYSEPYLIMKIPSSSYGQWKSSGNKLAMRVKVQNASLNRTVKAFKIYMYATDIWGERLYGDTTVYYETTKKTVKPGETVYCNYVYLPQRKDIDRVYVGIYQVICTDGTLREADKVDYSYWIID